MLLGELPGRPTRYKVNDDGTISTLTPGQFGLNNNAIGRYDAQAGNFPYGDLLSAQNAQAKQQQANIKNLQDTYEKRLAEVTSKENTYNSLSDQNYNSEFTADMIKDPAAPVKKEALSKEKFFYDVYKPSIGGDAGLLSFFPSGGRGAGQVDGSPRVPDYNQFLAGSSTYSHRHDGKVYSMSAKQDTKKMFNDAFENYKTNLEAENVAAQKNYETELGYSTAARGLSNITNT